jgi:lipid-A-disaccharide synthase
MASILVVAGDPSGDAHAARLVETLRLLSPSLTFSGLGGPAMQRAGVSLLEDLTAAASIGPFDASRHLGRFIQAKRRLAEHLRTERPALAILVDFGDFNLPVIAPLVHQHGIPIVYYISPQIWAWGRFRLHYVKRYVERMIVFFTFEEAFYRKAGVPVSWVGHPLVEAAAPSKRPSEVLERLGLNPWRIAVGLLPGSREHEIRRHLPLMLAVAQEANWRMPGLQFVIPKAPTVARETLERYTARAAVDCRIAEGPVADVLQVMEAALVASGTATLDAALANLPMAVLYRTSWPTYLAARMVVRIPHITMVNIIAGREVVPEFVQHRASAKRVGEALLTLLRDEESRQKIKTGLRSVVEQLGPPGAVARAAAIVLESLSHK